MNKWQIICPVAALLVAGIVFGTIAVKGQHRGFISVASRSIGGDLIARTNSSHLTRIGPELQAHLSELLGAPTQVADVRLGDDASPIRDGTASSRLVLTNELGKGLLIRLRASRQASMFEVVGFRSVSH